MDLEQAWIYSAVGSSMEESVLEEGDAKDQDMSRRHADERHKMHMRHAEERHKQLMRHAEDIHQHNLKHAKEHHKELSPAYLYSGGFNYNIVDDKDQEPVSPSDNSRTPSAPTGTSGGTGNTSGNTSGVGPTGGAA